MNRRWHMTVLAGLMAGAACGGDSDPGKPVAGDLIVSYTGGTAADGALLVLVNGVVTSVIAKSGYTVGSAALAPTSTRVVVTGPLVPGDLFTVRVPDVAAVVNYGVTVEAAADRTTFALTNPLSYQLSIRR